MTDLDIDDAQKRLSVVFPPKLREFMKAHNGGFPSRWWFTIPGHWDGNDRLDFFLAVDHPDPLLDLAKYRQDFPEYARRHLLPIGSTATAGLLCIDLSAPNVEPVVYLDVAEPEDPLVRRAYFVADDILEFCSMLKATPE